MAIGDLNTATWRIDVYELNPKDPYSGVITDLSNLYTSDLSISKQRNYPDEIKFTLDLQQLEERAKNLKVTSRDILQPYRHRVRCYRNNEFMAQGIVMKTTANLNNQGKNTIEVQCVDTLGLLEKRLIHQDYGEGSWADFAKEVVKDAQHEPNRIYNYAWEGDGVSVDNAWFRGWKYSPGEDTLRDFPEWEPNKLYSMYDTCTHGGKFWEAKEHAFYSGETFSESNWTLLGILDQETGDVAGAYGVWREDELEPGPTGTALGGWGGTSSCHMTAASFEVNNGGGISSISMKDSSVSTSLVAPFEADEGAPRLPNEYQELEYIESPNGGGDTNTGPYINTGLNARKYASRLKITADLELSSSNDAAAWHTVVGAATGTVNGTWHWNPQHHLALNSAGKWVIEYAVTNNYEVAASVKEGSAWTASRYNVVWDALPDAPVLTLTKNGQTETITGEVSRGADSEYGPDCNLYIFSRDYTTADSTYVRGSYCTAMKLYSMKIENSRGVLRDYVPAKRKSDGTLGLYDLINGKFYPKGGSGNFSGGPEVFYPSEVQTEVLSIAGAEYHTMGDEPVLSSVDKDVFSAMFTANYQDILDEGIRPTGVSFTGVVGGNCSCYISLSGVPTGQSVAQIYLWQGDNLTTAQTALAPWGITLRTE